MPACFRNDIAISSHDGMDEWREPPGWLGEFVRRVKQQSAAAQMGRVQREMIDQAREWRTGNQ